MANVFSTLPIDTGNAGPKMQEFEATVDGEDVRARAIVVRDHTNGTAAANVTDAAPAGDAYGVVVRVAGGVGLLAGGNTVFVNSGGTNVVNVADGGGSLTIDSAALDNIDTAATDIASNVSSLLSAQAGFGSAGTPASGVVTVQGIASMTALKVDGSGVTQPVSGTFWQATQPVSGTFWQATQPVSGPLTDTQLRAAAVPVSGTFWQATQPVSGPLTDTQLRATSVPVSATLPNTILAGVTAATYTGRDNAAVPRPGEGVRVILGGYAGWDVDLAGNVPVSGNNGLRSLSTGVQMYNGATFDALRGDAANGVDVDVTRLPALTKGTQSATGANVQQLKDAGRTLLNFFATSRVSVSTTEAALLLVGNSNGASIAGATATAQTAIVAGSRFRIETISIDYQGSNTAGGVQVFLRANTSGAAVLTSPIVGNWIIGAGTAGFAYRDVVYPDGLEFPSGTSFCLTVQGRGTNNATAALGYAGGGIYGFVY